MCDLPEVSEQHAYRGSPRHPHRPVRRLPRDLPRPRGAGEHSPGRAAVRDRRAAAVPGWWLRRRPAAAGARCLLRRLAAWLPGLAPRVPGRLPRLPAWLPRRARTEAAQELHRGTVRLVFTAPDLRVRRVPGDTRITGWAPGTEVVDESHDLRRLRALDRRAGGGRGRCRRGARVCRVRAPGAVPAPAAVRGDRAERYGQVDGRAGAGGPPVRLVCGGRAGPAVGRRPA